MKKGRLLFLAVFILLFLFPSAVVKAYAEDSFEGLEEIIIELVNGLDLTSLEEYFSSIFSGEKLKEVILLALKGEYLEMENTFSLLPSLIKNNLAPFISIFFSLLSVVVVCSVIAALKPKNDGLGDLIFMVCYIGIAVVVFSEVNVIIKSVSSVINKINLQTQSVFPIILTLLSAGGAKTSAVVYQPICVFLSGGVMMVITKLLLPMVSIIVVISMISSLSERFSLNKLLEFFTHSFKWIIGIIIAIFSVFTTVKGITASTYDGLSLRALKYAIGSSFPIISGFAKEGVDLVLTASILIKNAVGSVGIFLIFYTLLTPFLQVGIFSLSLKLLSAVTEPISDSRISTMINNLSKSVNLLATVLVMVFVVYFLTIILIIATQSGVSV